MWDRVDRSRGVIRLELTKSGRRREVSLSSNADAVLARRWRPGAAGYVFGSRNWNSFRSAWEAALAVAGIENFRFHDAVQPSRLSTCGRRSRSSTVSSPEGQPKRRTFQARFSARACSVAEAVGK
jgi:hypothetical protein